MGIEPTGRAVYTRPNGFEDRGHHQACKHFHFFVPRRLSIQNESATVAIMLMLSFDYSISIPSNQSGCPTGLVPRNSCVPG